MYSSSLKTLKQPVEVASMPLALEYNSVLGECLQWHAESGRWWWTDIETATLHAWEPNGAPLKVWKLPDRLGSFAHTQNGRLILGLAKRLCFATLTDSDCRQGEIELQPIVGVDAMEPRTRINDGRTDRSGNFVFGTINEALDRRPIGSFFQYSTIHGLRRLALPAVAIANSICFSLDGGTMYFCDTLSQTIHACDYYPDQAMVDHIRPFVKINDSCAWPDGSVIDAEGCMWNAQWGAGRILRYSPDGLEVQRVEVPVKNPSCPALGGRQGNELMVTTARKDLSRLELTNMPTSGSLFGMSLPAGLAIADTLFNDQPAHAAQQRGEMYAAT